MEILSLSPAAIELIYNPVINFALQQNYVPAIRELVIKNDTVQDWPAIQVSVQAEPAFAPVWKAEVPALKPGESYTLKPVIHSTPAFLAELTEKLAAHYIITIQNGGQSLYTGNYPVDLLAFDQWNGINLMPEMLAAFCTPNHPEIPKVYGPRPVYWSGGPAIHLSTSIRPKTPTVCASKWRPYLRLLPHCNWYIVRYLQVLKKADSACAWPIPYLASNWPTVLI